MRRNFERFVTEVEQFLKTPGIPQNTRFASVDLAERFIYYEGVNSELFSILVNFWSIFRGGKRWAENKIYQEDNF